MIPLGRDAAVRLVVTDGHASDWVASACAVDVTPSRWEVLPLGISVDQYRMEHAGALGKLKSWTFVDIQSFGSEARAEFRRTVPQFLYDLRRQRLPSGKTLQDLFESPAGNLWWFLEISEKSAHRGWFLNRLYYLLLIRAAVAKGAYGEVWLSLQDQLLASTVRSGLQGIPLRQSAVGRASAQEQPKGGSQRRRFLASYLGNAIGMAALHLLRCWFLRGLRIAKAALPMPNDVLFCSFYPSMWSNPYGPRPSEWFFGSLPEALSKVHPWHYGIWLTCRPWEIWRQRAALRSFFKDRPTVSLTSWGGSRAIGDVLAPAHLWQAIRFVMKWQFAIRANFAGYDVADLVAQELRRSLCSREYFLDLLLRRALERLTRAATLAAVIYRLECQPFEKAILYGIRGRARSVAVQHSIFGCNYLPYFFLPEELRMTAERGPGAMPVPDLIITSGPLCQDIMVRNGFPSERVAVCGPVRYSRLLQYRTASAPRAVLRERLGWGPDATILYVATGLSREDGLGVLAAIAQGLTTEKRVCVIFKSHPALPLDDEFRRLVVPRLGPTRHQILPLRAPFYNELAAADAALVTGSTVALEAVCLGVFPVLYASGAVFEMKTFEPMEWAGLLVGNADELKAAIRMVVEQDPRVEALKGQWPNLIHRWFDCLEADPNARFLEILNKQGFLKPLEGQRAD